MHTNLHLSDAPRKDPFVPELPEVETTRRSLERLLSGTRLTSARAIRADVVRGDRTPPALLAGQAIASLARHGKQLALIGADGACVSIHLGMSGRLEVAESGTRRPPHTHVVWTTEDGRQLRFIDPRRFGGVWTHRSLAELQSDRWSRLGPDAASLTTAQLRSAVTIRSAPIKSVLLDQRAVAGIGNIYADEALHSARIRPQRTAKDLVNQEHATLARKIRSVLTTALRAGGTTLRDYRTPEGTTGAYSAQRLVYGRAGQACPGCRQILLTDQTAARTTVWCPNCQH